MTDVLRSWQSMCWSVDTLVPQCSLLSLIVYSIHRFLVYLILYTIVLIILLSDSQTIMPSLLFHFSSRPSRIMCACKSIKA
jgi:hypothetical protein